MNDCQRFRRLLVLGLGNDLISDDGFGPAVVALLREGNGAFGDRPGIAVHLESAAVAGFRLLDILAGHDAALIVDVVQTGAHPPGTLLEWPLAQGDAARTLGGSHQMGVVTALELGRRMGMELPPSVTLLVAEAADLATIREELTEPLQAVVPRAVDLVRMWIDQTGSFAPATRRDDGKARPL